MMTAGRRVVHDGRVGAMSARAGHVCMVVGASLACKCHAACCMRGDGCAMHACNVRHAMVMSYRYVGYDRMHDGCAGWSAVTARLCMQAALCGAGAIRCGSMHVMCDNGGMSIRRRRRTIMYVGRS